MSGENHGSGTRPNLYSSRLVVRFVANGRPLLGSLIEPASLPLNEGVRAIFRALWDRSDPRSVEARLDAVGAVPDPDYRELLLDKMAKARLLLEPDFDEAQQWFHQLEDGLGPRPLVDQVELTNACPLTCVFCPRGLGEMTRPVGHLDLSLLEKIVDEVKDLPQRKPFGLHHFGDPLLHPDPAGAVRIVRRAGLDPEISFNPVFLKEATAEALLDAGVGVIIVSMDGLDTETLHKLRGRPAGHFEDASRKVEALIDRVAQMPPESRPTVMISMVANAENRHQWRELFHRYQRPEHPWLVPVVRRLDDFGAPSITTRSVAPLRQLCGAPYTFVSILWDGRVVPCCHDFDGRIVYGNVREQSLEEIWHGAAMRQFRERWRAYRFNPDEPCARCSWRVDLYMKAPDIAQHDAWTAELWPEGIIRGEERHD